MAIPMPIVQDIRRLDRQGMSRAQIARRLHVDRGTVAKYADMEDCSPKPKADRRYGSKIDPYAHLVDEWLEADRLLPRKQRHTIRRVHDRLLAETDYDGEYSTTMRYVHRWREANCGVPDREGYVCVCSIESGPCERVDVFHVSGRFWSTSACGEKRTPARPAWTSFPS